MNFINVIYLLLLIPLYLCEEDDKIECDEQCQKMVKQREENNKKFNETLLQTLKEMNLESATKLTKEQFKPVFMKLFKLGKTETNYKEEDDETFRNHIFNNLLSENTNEIEVDKIFKYFEPINILRTMKKIELSLGKYDKIDVLTENLRKAVNEKEEELRKQKEQNTDL